MVSPPIHAGKRHRVVYVTEGLPSKISFPGFVKKIRARGLLAGMILGKEFPNAKVSPAVWKRLLNMLDMTVKHGVDVVGQNPENCRPSLKGEASVIGEYKPKPYRIMFFEDGNLIVLTHWFKKQGDETPPREIDRAMRLREKYFDLKSGTGV